MSSLTDLAHDTRSARIVLSMIGRPNDPATGRLLTEVGAVEVVRFLGEDSSVPGMSDAEAAIWRAHAQDRMIPDLIAAGLANSEKYVVLIPGDAHWPTSLNDLGHRAPYALWTRGDVGLLNGTTRGFITITGARAPTSYGQHVAQTLAVDLAVDSHVTVAGGAYGIEGAAHRGTLAAGGSTIAVMASGIDRPYPAGHSDLFEQIERTGLMISEVTPGSTPTRQRFIDRARILTALSDATVIVEAGTRSGSLETARQAQEIGRAVAAIPGPITSAASYGTNQLIQQGRAHLVTSATDIDQLVQAQGSARQSPALTDLSQRIAPRASAVTRSL